MNIKDWRVLREMFQILSIPFYDRAKISESAIVIPPGQLQEYRIAEGVKLWPSKAKYLWVTGAREKPSYTREQIVSYCQKDSPDILVIKRGWNAKEQVLGIHDLLINRFPWVQHVIVATAAYHLPRWILTFLQTIKDTERQIVISPVPLLNPDGISFSVEDLRSEIEKIQTYRIKGDVASSRYLNTYLKWRLSQ